jgi:uncharacterized protein
VRSPTPKPQGEPRADLLRLYGEVDALTEGGVCQCSEPKDVNEAFCCHFGRLGREPYVTALEMAEVARAVAARGSSSRPRSRHRLPLLEGARTCPLLSEVGRCTVYEARPLGCRTYFCQGHEPPGARRKILLDLSRRLADLSAKAFPRDSGPRPFLRALAVLQR